MRDEADVFWSVCFVYWVATVGCHIAIATLATDGVWCRPHMLVTDYMYCIFKRMCLCDKWGACYYVVRFAAVGLKEAASSSGDAKCAALLMAAPGVGV